MKTYMLAAIAGLSLIGCNTPCGMSYDIILDHSLTDNQMEIAVASTVAWQNSVSGLKLTVNVGDCSGTNNQEFHTICIFVDSVYDAAPVDSNVAGNTVLATTDPDDNDNATIHIWKAALYTESNGVQYQNIGDIQFQNVVSHELDHAMTHKGYHLQDKNALMYASAPRDHIVTITEEDIQYFWSVR